VMKNIIEYNAYQNMESDNMAHIEGYADFLVETIREQLGYNADDNSHDDEVLAKLTAGEKLSKSKHIAPQTKAKIDAENAEKLKQLKSLLVEFESAHYGGFRPSTSDEEIEVLKWAIKKIEG
jgi:hypothetical protein